ncbi:MAG: hypothetical protein K0Q49_1354 [Haloplasmataceae bacterium]|jgi:hypothetical protein|nr:hypothetical protein [Haloplasmataceae bacterium]
MDGYQDAKKAQNTLFLTTRLALLNLIFIFLIPSMFSEPLKTIFTFMLAGIFIIITMLIILQSIKLSKILKKLIKETLLPLIINNVNPNWYISNDCFKKEEIMNSLFIDRNGSVISTIKIIEVSNFLSFSHIINYISLGDTEKVIFKGSFISYKLSENYDGLIHIRCKGKPTKNNSLIKINKIKNEFTNHYSNLLFYSNNQTLFNKIVNKELIDLYLSINNLFKKKIYLTIYQNNLYLGIQNSLNYSEFNIFKRLNDQNINEKINYLKKIDNINHIIYEYIKSRIQ